MPVDQKRLAQLLGIAQSTVSRALSGSPKVSDDTKLKVRELCKQLGYVADSRASSLSSGRTQTISVVLPPAVGFTMSDVHSRWVSHIQQFAHQRGYKTRIDSIEVYDTIALDRSTDGLIAFTTPGDPGNLVSAEMCPLPVVFTDCVARGEPGTVAMDSAGGVAEAVRHLVGLGHRNIAFVGHMPYGTPDNLCLDRYRGYAAQLNDLGLPAPSQWTLMQKGWPNDPDDCVQYADAIVGLLEGGVTALVCTSDMMAVGAAKALMRRGYTVPRDISVVGFDDALSARAFEPPITTVRQDIRAASQLAVDMLVHVIETGELGAGLLVPAPLVVRRTTGPPASA